MLKSKKLTNIFILLIIVTPLTLIPFGIDFTDTGWMLTYFQNIFTNPESISFWFHLYLTHLIGGIWNLFFGNIGLLGFKIAGVLLFWSTTHIVYKIFKGNFERNHILFGITMGLIYNFLGKITIIHYNNLSLLFFALTVLFIKLGLSKSSKCFVFAGISVALNSFVRLPNILSCIFIIAILYYRHVTGDTAKRMLTDLLLCIVGFLAGAIFIITIMKLLNHFDIYVTSLTELFITSDDELSSKYGLNSMIKRYISQSFKACKISIISFVIIIPIAIIFDKVLKKSKLIYLLLLIILITISFILYKTIFYTSPNKLIYLMIGSVFLTILFMFLSKNKFTPLKKTIALLVFLTITVSSIGSDTGMKVGSYTLIMGLPLLVSLLLNKSIKVKYKKQVLILLFTLYITIGLSLMYSKIYRDHSNILKLNTSVDLPLLRGIRTTVERAKAIEIVINELNKLENKHNTLLCFESIGMIHYLTETKPYISNPWPLLESPSQFNKLLESRKGNFLPIIVTAKKQTRSQYWPNSGVVSQWEHDIKNREILDRFIEENKYKEIWSNTMFRILKPVYQ